MNIAFGALAPSLVKQLEGVRIDAEQLLYFDADADAITHLNIRGVLTDAEALAARRRLLKNIERAAKEKV